MLQKSVFCVGLLLFQLFSSYATNPDVENPLLAGELNVYIGDVPSSLESVSMSVQLDLNGVVYSDEGLYSTAVTSSHPDYDHYASNNLYGTSGTLNASIPSYAYCMWESVYSADGLAEKSFCPGMIGYGDYKLVFTIDGYTEFLYLNAIDGNWFDPNNGNNNKVCITVNVAEVNNQIDLSFDIWMWTTSGWITKDGGSRICIWDIIGQDRNRSEITNGSFPFTWDDGNMISVPLVLNEVNVDHHVTLWSDVTILADKTVNFTDYYDGAQYQPTTVKIAGGGPTGGTIFVAGSLVTSTEHDVSDYYCVIFTPSYTFPHPNTRNSWKGIEVTVDKAASAVLLQNALLEKATWGVKSMRKAPIEINKSLISLCEVGIKGEKTRLMITSSEITKCGDGVYVIWDMQRYGRSYIFDSYIHNNYPLGDSVSGHGYGIWLEQQAEFDSSVIRPEQFFLIKGSRINYNWAHGIYDIMSMHAAVDCELAQNGYRWGRLRSTLQYYERFDGVWGSAAYSVTHHCDLHNNTAYGHHNNWYLLAIMSYHDYIYENGTPSMYIDIDGENCYSDNNVNIGTDYWAVTFSGEKGSNAFYDHRNSFKNPRLVTTGGAPLQATADHESKLYIEENYWYPLAPGSWDKYNNAEIYLNYFITNPNEVRCGTETSIELDPQGDPGDNEDIKLVRYHLMRGTSPDSLWQHTINGLGSSLTDTELDIATLSLLFLYRFAKVDAARDTLLKYAYSDQTAYLPIGIKSLHRIIGANFLDGNLSEIRENVDSLRIRETGTDGDLDTLYFGLIEANILYRLENVKSQAVDTLEALGQKYPGNVDILQLLFEITGDTAYVTCDSVLERKQTIRPNDKPLPEIDICVSPNPIRNNANVTIAIDQEKEVVVEIYNNSGRLIRDLYIGRIMPGVRTFVFDASNIPAGEYYCSVKSGAQRIVEKIIIVK